MLKEIRNVGIYKFNHLDMQIVEVQTCSHLEMQKLGHYCMSPAWALNTCSVPEQTTEKYSLLSIKLSLFVAAGKHVLQPL